MTAAKHILRYLKGTIDYGILFLLDNLGNLITYVDADYARDRDTWRSTGDIIYKLGEAPIAAASKLQPTVSRSIVEAKYRVTSDIASNIKYLRQLMQDLSICTRRPTVIYRDN
jgi:hypothetical protein